MRHSLGLIWLACTLLMVLSAGCECEEKNPSFPGESGAFMELEPNYPTVRVGLTTPLAFTASVTKDAEGGQCTFTATAGSFDPTTLQLSLDTTVDVNGRASVDWYAPGDVGQVRLTATIETVRRTVLINVSPVPEVVIEGLPNSMPPDTRVLFSVHVPADWSNMALEVRTVGATLQATGPTEDNNDRGTRILPLTDRDGLVLVLFTAPDEPMDVPVTASLFGTRNTVMVRVDSTGAAVGAGR